MYTEDYIRQLKKQIVRFNNADYVPVWKAVNIIEKMAEGTITWSEEDFKIKAIEKTNVSDWDQYYNKEMFSEALRIMIERHDATVGITWDTIDYYLETYCKIKDQNDYGKS